MSRRVAVTAAGLVSAALLGVAAAVGAGNWLLSPVVASAPDALVEVRSGASLGEVAHELESRGLGRLEITHHAAPGPEFPENQCIRHRRPTVVRLTL